MILANSIIGAPLAPSETQVIVVASGDVKSTRHRFFSSEYVTPVAQGTTIARSYEVQGPLTNWSARAQIRDVSRTSVIYDSSSVFKDEEKNQFHLNIQGSVTQAAFPGDYILAVQFDNSLTGENVEVLERINIGGQWVY